MSQQNVEIVRRAIDAFIHHDLDAAVRDNDSEVEVDFSRSRGVEAGIYHGHEDVRAFWRMFLDAFDRISVSVDEFIECGEHVVVPNRTCFWGREGIEVEAHSTYVVTFRNGRIVEWRLFQTRAEALKAVG
ncbi:MAG: SnoaL-like domain [Solirubrobacteraceae bacterium]|jgi:ketosteroid isomerase-like protein|nr:SnoaL-like domain [Solirubrobacteraceae bacterium]